MKHPLQKTLILLFLVFAQACGLGANISMCTWNLKDFGNTKNDSEIKYIAGILMHYDINAIQEVVAISGGTQAVARLVDALNRTGANWDYCISDPTVSSSYKTERYAFIWNKSKIRKIGDAWIEKKYNLEIDREPYFATFSKDGKKFTLVNFHAKTKSKQPETEIKYFKYLPAEYPKLNLIFCGDFNFPESHSVFDPLKAMGYASVLQGQKTTLRDRCLSDGCLASEFDNVFYKKHLFKVIQKGIVHFYKDFPNLETAKGISDHVPVWWVFQ